MFRTASVLIATAGMVGMAWAQPGEYLDMSGRPMKPPASALEVAAKADARIDVVFVLDTTGSMGGLIEGAKEKIWAIANQIATATPRPKIRMGLVAYRDRGDEYVTKLTPLTEDLDAVYSALMGLAAGGGGDGPESVNQAVAEAVGRFEWDRGAGTLRMMYLVGDAPPHVDYDQDVRYMATCERAAREGIVINTVQCGGDAETARVWKEIALSAEGRYFAIPQSGGVVAVATPYDGEIAALGAKIDSTVIAYGSEKAQAEQNMRMAVSAELSRVAPARSGADRAAYKASAAGAGAVGGRQELVNDVKEGRASVRELKDEELPPEMRGMSREERETFVAGKAKEREEIQKRVNELNTKRQAFIREQGARSGAGRDSFDAAVLGALREQAARRGFAFPGEK